MLWLFGLFLLLAPVAAIAQVAGEVLEVSQPAQLLSGGSSRTMSMGSAVSSGDVIKTGATGRVHLRFTDDTKIVVGPNSKLRLDETLFLANGTARKFATSALGGTFRFITGSSPKRVYKLSTPVATMGIRGTVFDYTVVPGQRTDLLVFDGLVGLCSAGRNCVAVPGGCQAIAALSDGSFTQPLDAKAKRALLLRRFPLLADQTQILPAFRVGNDGCQKVAILKLPAATERGENGGNQDGGNPPGGGNPAE